MTSACSSLMRAAARLVEQKALDPSLPGLDDVIDQAAVVLVRRHERQRVRGGDRARPFNASSSSA